MAYKSPVGGRELGVSEQLEHQVGECGRWERSQDLARQGFLGGKRGSPLIESMGNQREQHVHTVYALLTGGL